MYCDKIEAEEIQYGRTHALMFIQSFLRLYLKQIISIFVKPPIS